MSDCVRIPDEEDKPLKVDVDVNGRTHYVYFQGPTGGELKPVDVNINSRDTVPVGEVLYALEHATDMVNRHTAYSAELILSGYELAGVDDA